jgi:alpha-beta hydrolase superfamily lysophospholipase
MGTVRSLIARGLALGLYLLLPLSAAFAQTDSVTFETVDEVELHGTFYPSNQGIKAPCVLMLHDLSENGNHSGEKEWTNLAQKLQKNGFAVLNFDFRGFGKSTNVTPAFWKAPFNSKIKGAALKPSTIRAADFPAWYMPLLANDIAAARRFLDEKNDAKQCNSRNLFLIGAQEGATLGVLWLATEWQRRPRRQESMNAPPFGQDVAAGVWLSILPTMKNSRRPEFQVDKWIAPLRDRTPMLFLYGEDDRASSAFTAHLCEKVLKLDVPPRVKTTGAKELKTHASGASLLAQRSLGADEKILSYLNNIVQLRDDQDWMDRGTKKAQENFVNLRGFNLPLP